jgi:hypothetical protein
MRYETPEDRIYRLIHGLLTADEIALIQGKLCENGGELLLTSVDDLQEIRYLPAAPSAAEQIERRKRAVSRVRNRRGCQAIVAYVEKRNICFEEIVDEPDSAAR